MDNGKVNKYMGIIFASVFILSAVASVFPLPGQSASMLERFIVDLAYTTVFAMIPVVLILAVLVAIGLIGGRKDHLSK